MRLNTGKVDIVGVDMSIENKKKLKGTIMSGKITDLDITP